MARLSKVQTYAIQWLHSQNTPPDKIAGELDLNLDQVNKALEKCSSIQAEKTLNVAQKPVSTNTNMINETSAKKIKNVSIMTEGASQQHDQARSKFTRPEINTGIFRPKNHG